MEVPEGLDLPPDKQGCVCKLKKALYGLKQSPKAWFDRIDLHLILAGFLKNPSDSNVYKYQDNEGFVMLALYVDDTVLVSNSPHHTLAKVKKMLSLEFAMTDLGELHSFLGIKIERMWAQHTISLSQAAYVQQVLAKYNMTEVKPSSTPMNTSAKLSNKSCPTTKEEIEAMALIPYRQACGSLQHLQVSTRPDISKATSVVCQFFQNPGQQHWTAVKCVLRYLKGTQNYGLVYKREELKNPGSSTLQIVSYTDSDWAEDPDLRRSTAVYVTMASSAPLSWSSKRLQIVCLSSTEAEYAACTEAAKELISHRKFAEGLGTPIQGST